MQPKKFKVTVTDIANFGPRSSLYRLSISDEFSFESGQFVQVVLKDKDGKEVRRSYSIASSPNDKGKIELLVTMVEGGIGSGFFAKLKAGDTFEIFGPMGVFKVHEPMSDPVYFIATGCGIAPFISMIRSLLEKGIKSKIVLLYGFRNEVDYLCRDYVNDLLDRYKNFEVIPTVSKPQGKWEGYVGRVTSLVDIEIKPKEDTRVYLCGQKEMVAQMAELLVKRGIKEKNIFLEKWS